MLHAMDAGRRLVGRAYDAAGLGPREAPWRMTWQAPGLRLRAYGGDGPPALVVPAPIKRPYLWDIAPDLSVLRRLMAAGFAVRLAEWTEDGGGFDAAAGQALAGALARVAGEAGTPAVLLGHSLGGTLAAIVAALHPDKVAGLVLIEAPLAFGDRGGPLVTLVSAMPEAGWVTAMAGGAPGSLLDIGAVTAAPESFLGFRVADAAASLGEASRLHLMVHRWTLDEFAMPPRLFEDVAERLYRRDQFARGELTVAGQPAVPAALTMPVLAVVDPGSRVVPAASTLAVVSALANPRNLVLETGPERGVALDHAAPLVGPRAHAVLWPRIIAWMEAGVGGGSALAARAGG